jgi:hypothetical protein
MYKELAQYTAPKRKALEMKAEGRFSLVDVIRAIGQRDDRKADMVIPEISSGAFRS